MSEEIADELAKRRAGAREKVIQSRTVTLAAANNDPDVWRARANACLDLYAEARELLDQVSIYVYATAPSSALSEHVLKFLKEHP